MSQDSFLDRDGNSSRPGLTVLFILNSGSHPLYENPAEGLCTSLSVALGCEDGLSGTADLFVSPADHKMLDGKTGS